MGKKDITTNSRLMSGANLVIKYRKKTPNLAVRGLIFNTDG